MTDDMNHLSIGERQAYANGVNDGKKIATIKWRAIGSDPAPHDRPIGLLSVQAQSKGYHVTFDICEWRDVAFILGYGFDSGVGHSCPTHWCEVSELALPNMPLSVLIDPETAKMLCLLTDDYNGTKAYPDEN
jgi:hypothetical protein